MYKITQKVRSRISSGIKNFQSILKSAADRDINEADTVTIVTDIIAEIFGYDKYHEITSEFQIRSTYCDLATSIDGKMNLLIEVKAIGIDLKDVHTKQAVDYASNQGVDWVILTNGIVWQVYKVLFGKPIQQELVYSFNMLALNYKGVKDVELIFPLTREGAVKSSLEIYHDQRQALSRFSLGALILSDPFLNNIKRELRKMSPGVKFEIEEIKDVLTNEIIKREVIENEKLKSAKNKITRALSKSVKTKSEPKRPELNKSNEGQIEENN